MSEERKRQNSEAAKRNLEQKKNIFGQKDKCPHCGIEANLATLRRSHYDKCKVYQAYIKSIWTAKSKKLR